MKNRTFMLLLTIIIFATMFLVNIAFHLMNQPSNAALTAGFMLLGIVFVFVPTLVSILSRRIK